MTTRGDHTHRMEIAMPTPTSPDARQIQGALDVAAHTARNGGVLHEAYRRPEDPEVAELLEGLASLSAQLLVRLGNDRAMDNSLDALVQAQLAAVAMTEAAVRGDHAASMAVLPDTTAETALVCATLARLLAEYLGAEHHGQELDQLDQLRRRILDTAARTNTTDDDNDAGTDQNGDDQ